VGSPRIACGNRRCTWARRTLLLTVHPEDGQWDEMILEVSSETVRYHGGSRGLLPREGRKHLGDYTVGGQGDDVASGSNCRQPDMTVSTNDWNALQGFLCGTWDSPERVVGTLRESFRKWHV
jgi:hypothetical protein